MADNVKVELAPRLAPGAQRTLFPLLPGHHIVVDLDRWEARQHDSRDGRCVTTASLSKMNLIITCDEETPHGRSPPPTAAD